MMEPLLALAVLVVIVVCWFQLFGELVYDYRLEQESVRFILFRFIPVWRIPYSEIADISPASRLSLLSRRYFPPFGFMNKPAGQLVVIKRNRGILRNVFITPRTPAEFVAAVRAAAAAQSVGRNGRNNTA
jgi:hypothetical protein